MRKARLKRPFPRRYLSSPIVNYEPWYNDKADYNTNAKSYYDYLARWNRYISLMTDQINRLIDRDIDFLDTTSIDFTKVGNWIDNGTCDEKNYDDVLKISAVVIISQLTETKNLINTAQKTFTVQNGTKVKNDGVWSPDYFPLLEAIDGKLGDLQNQINTINNTLTNLQNQINTINNTLTSLQNQINNLNNEISSIKNDINSLKNRVTTTENALQKIINNLFNSGAITNNNLSSFEFKTGRNIATGNINFFGGTQDGTSFIRTNNGSTENDVTAGI